MTTLRTLVKSREVVRQPSSGVFREGHSGLICEARGRLLKVEPGMGEF